MKKDTQSAKNPDPYSEEQIPNQESLPVAPARVAVLKASYRQAWFYFLMIICLVVAWGVPLRYYLMRKLAFHPAETGQRDAHEFVALVYEGISESNAREVTPQRFNEQLAALRKAGYQSITLADIKDFYLNGKLLPRKAVLMTFDQSRKSSYFDARSALRKASWNAVMFLWTKPIIEEDPASLRWPYVRAMLRSGAWEAGAQSYNGFDRVVADNSGTRRNFLTTPKWSSTEMRYETPEEFSVRLNKDHEACLSLIEQETGERPKAFAFPYGDFGQYDERAILSRRFNLDLVSKYYDLAFILGTSALNTQNSDRRRLNRLLVNPDWSGADLVQRLEYSWPQRKGYASPSVLKSSLSWLVNWGGFKLQDGEAKMVALPETTGSKVWLNGSDDYRDINAHLVMKIDEGQAGVFLRATPDGEAYLYLGLGKEGDVWLRQKHAGMQPFTLSSGRYTLDPAGKINLDLHVRDRIVYVEINGRPAFQEIPSTRGVNRPGMIGFSIWHPQAGVAQATISELAVRPSVESVVEWNPISSRAPPLAYWLSRNAYRYTHLAPPWLRVASRGMIEQFGWDTRTMSTFASSYRMQLVPEITLDSLENFEPNLPEQIAARASDIKAAGVTCNLRDVLGNPPLSRIIAWIQNLSRAMEEKNLSLVLRLPAVLEKPASFSALFQVLPNLKIAVAPDSPLLEAQNGGDSNRVVSAEVVEPYEDLELSLYYELAGSSATGDVWSSEMRSELLRQEGRNAYNNGDYAKAIEIWTRWSTLEPMNEEPVSLVGDVHLRLGEVEQAVAFYRRSLEINPGQIGLAVRCARLMDTISTDQGLAARQMLNLYARIFPNNPDVALAQAEWLVRRKRYDEAGALIRKAIALYPDDLRSRTMLHGLLTTPEERFENMKAIIAVGSKPGMEPHLASAIRDYDLFTRPESWMLMSFLEKMAASTPPGPDHDVYDRLLPRDTVASEDFRAGRMSANWTTSIVDPAQEGGSLVLGAEPTQTEAFLRLVKSDSMHNGFIEALIDDARGFFWLYARRGEGNMIRFGFDQTGRMYLQVWRDGQMMANETRFWTKPTEPTRLRLELRGDGAFGFVDGKPAFGAPAAIPRDMGLGWWGIAPWAPQFGVAQVSVRQVAGGPLPVRLGVFKPRDTEWLDQDYLEALKNHTREMSAIAPQWYVQDMDGHINKETQSEHGDLRILCRYYRMRMLPSIRSASPRTLKAEELIRVASEDHVDGFVLLFAKMPDEDWYKQMEEALQGTSLTLVAVTLDEEKSVSQVRDICPYVGLFPGARKVHTLPIIPVETPAKSGDGEIEQPMDAKSDSALLLF